MSNKQHRWLGVKVDTQWFALPLTVLAGVIEARPVTPVPGAPPVIAGVIPMRQGLVLVLDMRRELGLPPLPNPERAMMVRFDVGGEGYVLLVDAVGDVFDVEEGEARPVPAHLDAAWRRLGAGLVTHTDGLVLLLDPGRLAAPRIAA